MFIDTHCHLTDDYCNGVDNNEIIKRAMDAGVGMIICPTADPLDIPGALKLAAVHDNIYCTIGIHPEYAPMDASQYLTDDVLNNPRVVGVGEIGLDFHQGNEKHHEQILLFEQQLEIARQYNLPVAIHTRDAEEDTAAILNGDISGVMHCFTSSWNLAKTMLDRGFFFSASGILTFKNAPELRETFAKIPIDRIIIETDAPYCAPVPYRGKVCEPAMVVETAKVLAAIKGLPLHELEHILMENVQRLYPKIKSN
ncbi:MAG: TatD family hydrolase [Alphaproteobacteria bacterium]|nr:TatD family hydrolase [Alphaproteobacteria bacterium]